MSDEPLNNLIRLMVSESELQAIENWRFAHRVSSRSEAVRRLISLGFGASPPSPFGERDEAQDAVPVTEAPSAPRQSDGLHGFAPMLRNWIVGRSEVKLSEMEAIWTSKNGSAPTPPQSKGIVAAMGDLGWTSIGTRTAPGAAMEHTFFAPGIQ